jgi:hypothetical protein
VYDRKMWPGLGFRVEGLGLYHQNMWPPLSAPVNMAHWEHIRNTLGTHKEHIGLYHRNVRPPLSVPVDKEVPRCIV